MKTRAQVSPPIIENPFYSFCESLKLPYAGAKQYFDQLIIEIDVYNDGTYFYDFYKGLESKDQDTVYNNLQRIYDVTKDDTDKEKKRIKKSVQKMRLPRTKQDEEWMNFLKQMSDNIHELEETQKKAYKLSVLSKLLDIADNYKHQRESVDLCTFEEKYKEISNRQEKLSKKINSVFFLSLISNLLIFFAVSILGLYIYTRVGSEGYIRFVEENYIQYIIFPVGASLVTMNWEKIKNIIRK